MDKPHAQVAPAPGARHDQRVLHKRLRRDDPRIVDLSGPHGGFPRPRARPVEALPPLRQKTPEHEARYLDALGAKYRTLLRLLGGQPDVLGALHKKYRRVVKALTAADRELEHCRAALAATERRNTALEERCDALEAQLSERNAQVQCDLKRS